MPFDNRPLQGARGYWCRRFDKPKLTKMLEETGKIKRARARGGDGDVALQHLHGKICEQFVADVAKATGRKAANVDWGFRTDHYCWDDVEIDGKNFSVKSCDNEHEASWVFERLDPMDHEFYAFVQIHCVRNIHWFCHLASIKNKSELIFGEMRKEQLRPKKHAIYARANEIEIVNLREYAHGFRSFWQTNEEWLAEYDRTPH